MDDFLGKYYPGIKKMLHKRRILALIELLEEEKKKFKEQYHENFSHSS